MSELIGSQRQSFVGGRFERAVRPADGREVDAVSVYPEYDDTLKEGPSREMGAAEAVSLDEDEGVSLDELGLAPDGEDVVQDLAISAAATGKGFDGPLLAELLSKSGESHDVRLSIAIEVLRLGSKLTGDKMLAVLESLGFEGEVLVARVARDELAKIPDVPVESTTPLPPGSDGGDGQ